MRRILPAISASHEKVRCRRATLARATQSGDNAVSRDGDQGDADAEGSDAFGTADLARHAIHLIGTVRTVDGDTDRDDAGDPE